MVSWWRITAAKQEIGTVFRSNANANNNLAAPSEQKPLKQPFRILLPIEHARAVTLNTRGVAPDRAAGRITVKRISRPASAQHFRPIVPRVALLRIERGGHRGEGGVFRRLANRE